VQAQTEASAQLKKVLLAALGARRIGAAGVEQEYDLPHLGVTCARSSSQASAIASQTKALGLVGGAQGQEAGVVKVVVDPVGDQHALGQVAVIVIVDALNVAALARTRAGEGPEPLLFLGVDTEHRDAAGVCRPAHRIDVVELRVARGRIDRSAAPVPGAADTPRPAARALGMRRVAPRIAASSSMPR
jgi:hypothetical protein